MRTDSIRLSPQFTFAARDYIKENFGEDYLGFVKTQKEKDNVQDAHEAIRPTDITLTPDEVKKYLSTEEYNVYKLIWIRAVCSMMAPEKVAVTKVIFDNNSYLFMIDGKVRLFDGYRKIYDEYVKAKYSAIPEYSVNDTVEVIDTKIKEDVTKPPARYSEASLVKAMEELGIGRPSTYAATIEALNRSNYVTTEKKYLKPTDISLMVNDKLQEFFESFINVKYTANMEKDLDRIALNEMNKTEYLTRTYDDFKGLYDVASVEFKQNIDLLDEECPHCGSKLRLVHGKNGDFKACSNYPNCNFIKNEDREVLEEKCPHCGSNLRVIKGKFGEFISCTNYPLCNFRKNKITIPENAKKCPDCADGYLIVKKSQYGTFLGCTNYPNCRHMERFNNKK
jgi:DNA topoisomerase-1